MRLKVSAILCGIVFCIVSLTCCKKDNTPKANQLTKPLRDTTIVITHSDTVPVRVSFATGTYLDFTFISNLSEGRCPTCVNGRHDTCFHAGLAQADFQIKNELGETYTYTNLFNSCVTQIDTSSGLYYTPFHQNYRIYPIRLDPYPTNLDSIDWNHYTMTVYVKQI